MTGRLSAEFHGLQPLLAHPPQRHDTHDQPSSRPHPMPADPDVRLMCVHKVDVAQQRALLLVAVQGLAPPVRITPTVVFTVAAVALTYALGASDHLWLKSILRRNRHQ